MRRIEFHRSLRGAQGAWDASEAGDRSVLAWQADGVLHFAAEGGVIAPENCRDLFARYANCKEIYFNGCFDTSRVTDMSYMFYTCTSLKTLDLTGFNTSRVANMDSMFYGCTWLSSLNLSGFDTSRVTNMCDMFRKCRSLVSLDLSGFRFAGDARVRDMLADCYALRKADIRGFAALPKEAQASLPAPKPAGAQQGAANWSAGPVWNPPSAYPFRPPTPEEAKEDRMRVAKNLLTVVLIPLIIALLILALRLLS